MLPCFRLYRWSSPMSQTQYLLLKDVDGLGRTGDLVTAKPGFVNNYLEPQGKAVRADKRTLRMQSRLQEERAKQAEVDRKLSLEIADKLKELVLERRVKVDPEGKMYGSVTATEIEEMLKEKSIEVDKKFIRLHHPIKETGIFTVPLKLKEGVEAVVKVKVMTESGEIIAPKVPEPELKAEAEPQEETSETEQKGEGA